MKRWLSSVMSGVDLNQRIFYIIGFALLFTVMGNLIPYTYHRYFDDKNYFEYVGGLTLDRKLYNRCDTIYVSGTLKSEVDLGVVATVIYLMQADGKKNAIDVVKENQIIPKTGKDGFRFSVPRKIPCERADFKAGIYELLVQYEYEIKGNKKSYSIYSPQFTIIEQETLK